MRPLSVTELKLFHTLLAQPIDVSPRLLRTAAIAAINTDSNINTNSDDDDCEVDSTCLKAACYLGQLVQLSRCDSSVESVEVAELAVIRIALGAEMVSRSAMLKILRFSWKLLLSGCMYMQYQALLLIAVTLDTPNDRTT
jgi:hypothetical protein